MKAQRRLGAVMVLAALIVGLVPLMAVGESQPPSPPNAGHEIVGCYTHTGNNAHGSIVDNGRAVRLNTYQPSWSGDHWEQLRVRTSQGWGDWIIHPEAGVSYYGPGQGKKVEKWEVCKGKTPSTTTTTVAETTTTVEDTTTTTVEDTTTTTVEDTTTTTVEDTTTTTVDDTTTTTVDDETTTTVGETTTTVEVVDTTIVTSTTTPGDPELPFTGFSDTLLWVGLVVLALGGLLLALTRRPQDS